MADLLKDLADKARGKTKTQGEIEEGKGRKTYEFGGDSVFQDADDYTPDSSKGWNGLIPDEGNMAKQLKKTVERNKSK